MVAACADRLDPAATLDGAVVGAEGTSVPDATIGDFGFDPESIGRAIPTIPGYEILGELGRGGMGVVYRARQVHLDRPCALKMILAGAHADPVATVRFLTEAQAVARLQHPNVVQIHHIDAAGGLPSFELEYLEGGSLDRKLDGTPWPPGTRRVSSSHWPAPSPRPTGSAWSTATSSRGTSCWPATTRPRSPTSAWPRA
jgi:serine/threonine protein kinase